jgi:hypothetical protein
MTGPNLDDDKRKPISLTRILIWVAVGGVGLYMVISGLVGVLS